MTSDRRVADVKRVTGRDFTEFRHCFGKYENTCGGEKLTVFSPEKLFNSLEITLLYHSFYRDDIPSIFTVMYRNCYGYSRKTIDNGKEIYNNITPYCISGQFIKWTPNVAELIKRFMADKCPSSEEWKSFRYTDLAAMELDDTFMPDYDNYAVSVRPRRIKNNAGEHPMAVFITALYKWIDYLVDYYYIPAIQATAISSIPTYIYPRVFSNIVANYIGSNRVGDSKRCVELMGYPSHI